MKVFVGCNQVVISGLARACELLSAGSLAGNYYSDESTPSVSCRECRMKTLEIFMIGCVWLTV